MKQLGLITIFMFGLNQFFAQTIMNIHQSNGTVLEIPLTEIDSINYTFPGSGNGPTLDGSTYQTVVIGSQEWFAENLRTTVYANGDPIPNLVNWTDIDLNTSGAWMHYMHNAQLDNPFGKLYNYLAVSDVRNVCPTDWHIPSDNEWNILIDFLGGVAVAGGKMKSTGTEFWDSPNQDATNESGFSALPGGMYDETIGFYDMGFFGNYLSSDASYVELNAFGGGVEVYVGEAGPTNGYYYSARCVKD